MKKINSTLGLISIIVFAVGILFKSNHWPYSGLIITVSALGLIAFFIAYLLVGIKPLTTDIEKSIGIAGSISMCLAILGFVFKFQHWAGQDVFAVIAMAGLLVTSILLIIDSIKETDQTKQSVKTLFAFTLVTITAMLVMLLIPKIT
jgi:hypothetical protein